MISIDLVDAYLHVPIHPDHQKYLSFAYQGQVLRFRSLPFGLSPSPWLFTMIAQGVKVISQKHGLILHQYLDDWVVRAQSRDLLVTQTRWLLNLCHHLGFQVNYKKSELIPFQEFNFVGYHYNTIAHKVFPTEKRIKTIQDVGAQFLRSDPNSAQQWASLLGLLSSTEKLVPLGRMHLREIQYCLKSQWIQAHQDLTELVQLTPSAVNSLRWWMESQNLRVGSPTHCPKPNVQVFTDSSTQGWGAHLPGKLNVLADSLSRNGQILPTEWSISPTIFTELCKRFTAPWIDLFATRWNKKLQNYVSPIPDNQAAAVDALSMSWKGMWGYAFPPSAILMQVLNKIISDQCRILLIAPAFPAANWFQVILSLLEENPLELPPIQSLLKQPRSQIFHRNPGKLHTWLLSGKQSEQKAFRKKLPNASPNQYKSSIYDSKWKIFATWCQSRKIDPICATVQLVSEFLLEKQKGGLATRTLEGYRSAIANTLKHASNLDLSNNMEISAMLKNFRQTSMVNRNPGPKWSLTLVLNMLRNAPFEPLNTASLKLLTLKTVFLLALASGKRRGEIHAIHKKSISWPHNKKSITLRPLPSFIAKTQLATDVRALQPFQIKSLRDYISQGMDEDMKLCPVRAIFAYLDRTENLREGKQLLFISFKQGFSKDIAKSTISGWHKKTIVMAYESSKDQEFKMNEVKAQQVRAFAASTAFYNKFSIQDVMDACTWSNHNTFTSFYLRDMTEHMGDLLRLAPFVAGQSVINPSK